MNKLVARMQRNLATGKERGVTMVFAILIVFLVISIGAAIVSLALTASIGSRNLNYTMAFQAATDSALADATLVANSSDGGTAALEAHNGSAQAVTGTLATSSSSYPVKWRWYTSPVAANDGAQRAYYVYADAYSKDPAQADAHHVRLTLTPISAAAASVSGSNGQIAYAASPSSIFLFGAYGLNTINLNAGTKIGSYDSAAIRSPSATDNNAAVGSNGTLNLATGTGLNQFYASGSAAKCLGDGCSSITNTTNDYTVSLSSVSSLVTNACPNAPSSYPSWSASSGTPLVNGTCYGSLNFDANTVIGTLTKVYVPAGTITVAAGVQVNYNGLPSNLQIYGGSNAPSAVLTNGSTSAPTYFNGVIAGESMTCGDTATSASNISTLMFYGSLACNQLTFGPATTVWLDQQTRNISSTGSTSPYIYQASGYQVNGSVQ